MWGPVRRMTDVKPVTMENPKMMNHRGIFQGLSGLRLMILLGIKWNKSVKYSLSYP